MKEQEENSVPFHPSPFAALFLLLLFFGQKPPNPGFVGRSGWAGRGTLSRIFSVSSSPMFDSPFFLSFSFSRGNANPESLFLGRDSSVTQKGVHFNSVSFFFPSPRLSFFLFFSSLLQITEIDGSLKELRHRPVDKLYDPKGWRFPPFSPFPPS